MYGISFTFKIDFIIKSILNCFFESMVFYTKIVLTYCEKKLFWQSIKVLKFEAEGQEFAQFLRSLEQFIQTVKGQKKFW